MVFKVINVCVTSKIKQRRRQLLDRMLYIYIQKEHVFNKICAKRSKKMVWMIIQASVARAGCGFRHILFYFCGFVIFLMGFGQRESWMFRMILYRIFPPLRKHLLLQKEKSKCRLLFTHLKKKQQNWVDHCERLCNLGLTPVDILRTDLILKNAIFLIL